MKLNVPLIKQEGKLDCGFIALRMVLEYFGKNISSKEISKFTGGLKSYGNSTIELAEFARSIGFDVDCFTYNKKMSNGKAEFRKPSKKNIIGFLNNKIPVIITLRSFLLFDNKPSSSGHFIVINGYSDHMFYYVDPYDGKEHEIDEDKLLFAWHNNILNSSAYLLAIKFI